MSSSASTAPHRSSQQQPPQSTQQQQQQRPNHPEFPPHNAPRVWLLTCGLSPIAIALSRHLLQHGDYVVLGVLPADFEHPDRGAELKAFLEEVRAEGGDGESDSGAPIGLSGRNMADIGGSRRGGAGGSGGGGGGGGETGQSKRGSDSKTRTAKRWRERVRPVALDGRLVGQCQSCIAEAIDAFGRIDILLGCSSESLIGTVEELGQSARALALVQDQFETIFFTHVNMIRACLPTMRRQSSGHIIILSGITGHLGTPGLGVYCAAQWAIEGYCDSLAYEIAPFNVRMTVVQPGVEVGVLTNRVTAVPPLDPYKPDQNPAPLFREIIAGILEKVQEGPGAGGMEGATPASTSSMTSPTTTTTTTATSPPASAAAFSSSGTAGQEIPYTQSDLLLHLPFGGGGPEFSAEFTSPRSASGMGRSISSLSGGPSAISLFPSLPASMHTALIQETVFALTAIGGHDNPPARHIVGYEGVASVKEKLRTVSEELEEFVGTSLGVDY